MKAERGNILFLILLAVILFAVLSYAVTSSLRGGEGKSASTEKSKAMAAQVVNFGAMAENAFTRMRVMGNYPEWGYDLSDDTGPSTSNPNGTCVEKGCKLFVSISRDGNMTPIKFDESFIDPRLRATNPGMGSGSGSGTDFSMVRVINIGTDLPDLYMFIQGLKPEICAAINEQLWGATSSAIETYAWVAGHSYSGTLTALPTGVGVLGDEDPFYKGKPMGCMNREASGYGGDYYHVLWAR